MHQNTIHDYSSKALSSRRDAMVYALKIAVSKNSDPAIMREILDEYDSLSAALDTALMIEEKVKAGDFDEAISIADERAHYMVGDSKKSMSSRSGRRQTAGEFLDALHDNPQAVLAALGA